MTARLITFAVAVGVLAYSLQVILDGHLHALIWGGG